jgi:GNAT superfamily N-acetyltransferase
MKLVTLFCRRVTVMACPLDQSAGAQPPPPDETADFLSERDEAAYAEFRPGQPIAVMRRRLGKGERCLVARRQGRIVCAIWAVRGRPRDSYLGAWLALEPGDVYLHDVFTRPDCRRQGLARACYSQMMQSVRTEGSRRAVCLVAVENRPGRFACESAGFRAIGACGCLRIGPWRHFWQVAGVEDGAPGVRTGLPWTSPIPFSREP